MKSILILNGPNLNRLGTREPDIYGRDTLEDIRKACDARASAQGYSIDFRQSNFEGELVEMIHEACDGFAAGTVAGLVINPAGLSFNSVPLVDAIKMFGGPRMEVHLSNIHARDLIYQHSIVSKFVTAVIAGLGPQGYLFAIDAVVSRAK